MRLVITTEARNGYEPGDILAVLPDGARLGLEEDPAEWAAAGRDPAGFPNPWIAVVDVPGDPVDLNLAEPDVDDDLVEGGGATMVVRRRAWRVDLDRLTPTDRAAVDAPGGRVELPPARARGLIRDADGSSMPLRARATVGDRSPGTDGRARLARRRNTRARPARG